MLFYGDTLFPGAPGTTSFDGGTFATDIHSSATRLFTHAAHTVALFAWETWYQRRKGV